MAIMNTRNFDKEAPGWDSNPIRVKLAGDIATALAHRVHLKPDMEVLDFGCGSGLLTLFLVPFVKSVMALDSSRGMLDVVEKKIADQNITNVKPLYWDVVKTKSLIGKYHLITASMALHHVEDAEKLINIFYDHLLPGGFLAIADLDLDNGLFHEDKSGVFHNGFDRERLKSYFKRVGFRDIAVSDAAIVNKPVIGALKKFTVFLATGKK